MASVSGDMNMGAYFEGKWQEAHDTCVERLNDNDRRHLEEIRTCEAFKAKIPHMQNAFAQRSTNPLLNQLTPFMASLRNFLALLAVSTGSPPFETAMIWGIMSLAVQAASGMSMILTHTIDMLDILGHDLEILEIHEKTFEDNPSMCQELVEIFVEIIKFWTSAIHFFRRNNFDSTAMLFWPRVKEDFDKSSKKIKESCSRIKEKASAIRTEQLPARLLQAMDLYDSHIPTPPTPSESATMSPCYDIPFSRNKNFCGRQTELESVAFHLAHETSHQAVKSFALWGTGGVGKTQIALEYAYQRADVGVESIFWVNCETGLSIARSFTQIAKTLNLDGVMEDENSDKNRHLVLTWFRNTNVPWLMILDNVEDNKRARECWPIALHSSGSILVTSRRSILAIDPAAGGMQIGEFSDKQGADMLLYLVGRPSYTEAETSAAKSLSQQLGGLGLALAVMAAQVRTRRKSFREFLSFYGKYAARLHSDRRGIESQYERSLRTCWHTAFESLSGKAATIVGMLAFTAPDSIPQELFEPSSSGDLPEHLVFCEDELELEESLDELLDNSLINREPDTRALSIHRLIQFEYRDYIGPDGRYRSFKTASEQLYYKFPKQINGVSLRNEWSDCKKYAQHVLMLCAYWQGYKFPPKAHDDFNLLTKLLTNCSWYFLESGAWSEEMELMKTAFDVCKDKNGLDYAHLCNTHSCVQVERGRASEAIHLLDKTIEIRKNILGENHLETAHSYSNYGNSVQQAYKTRDSIKEALAYYLKAMEIDRLHPEEEVIKFSYGRYLNISRVYRLLKEYDVGLGYLDMAEKSVLHMFGLESFFGATLRVHRSNILFDQGKVDEAEKLWREAFDIFNKENNTHPATISVRLKLACLEMRRGEVGSAIKVMQKLLLTCELREKAKGDKGEIARVTRRLAEAHASNGNNVEATHLTAKAEAMRKEIQKDREWQLPDEERSYDILVWNEYW